MIVFNACSIEKKHASFGYHIEWRNNKFLEGNKVIAQKTKPKVTKEKAVVVPDETDLIMETNANAVVINQESKTEILIDSNENLKYNLQDKTRNINTKQLSIIKKSYDLASKKIPLPKQNKLEMPETIFVACISFGLVLLLLLIALFIHNSNIIFLLFLLAFVFLFIGIALILKFFLEWLSKLIFNKKDDNQYKQLKPKSH